MYIYVYIYIDDISHNRRLLDAKESSPDVTCDPWGDMTLSRLEVNCQAYNTAITACEKNANWQVFRAGRKDRVFCWRTKLW